MKALAYLVLPFLAIAFAVLYPTKKIVEALAKGLLAQKKKLKHPEKYV